MKPIRYAFLCLLLGGCTMVKDKTGQTRFFTSGNVSNLKYMDETTVLTADAINHAAIIDAYGTTAGKVGAAAAAVIVAKPPVP